MSDKQIGFKACINALGNEYYEKYKDQCVFVSEEDEKGLWCFVGFNTISSPYEGLHLAATIDDWEYYASCYVKDTVVTMDKCRLPKQ